MSGTTLPRSEIHQIEPHLTGPAPPARQHTQSPSPTELGTQRLPGQLHTASLFQQEESDEVALEWLNVDHKAGLPERILPDSFAPDRTVARQQLRHIDYDEHDHAEADLRDDAEIEDLMQTELAQQEQPEPVVHDPVGLEIQHPEPEQTRQPRVEVGTQSRECDMRELEQVEHELEQDHGLGQAGWTHGPDTESRAPEQQDFVHIVEHERESGQHEPHQKFVLQSVELGETHQQRGQPELVMAVHERQKRVETQDHQQKVEGLEQVKFQPERKRELAGLARAEPNQQDQGGPRLKETEEHNFQREQEATDQLEVAQQSQPEHETEGSKQKSKSKSNQQDSVEKAPTGPGEGGSEQPCEGNLAPERQLGECTSTGKEPARTLPEQRPRRDAQLHQREPRSKDRLSITRLAGRLDMQQVQAEEEDAAKEGACVAIGAVVTQACFLLTF